MRDDDLQEFRRLLIGVVLGAVCWIMFGYVGQRTYLALVSMWSWWQLARSN